MNETEYHMSSSILSQPPALLSVVEKNVDNAVSFSSSLKSRNAGTMYLVGTGTSFHAAELSSYFLPNEANKPATRAVPISSYEFANYTPALGKGDCVIVISHRGYKAYSNRSLSIAKEKGCLVGAVTGIGSTIGEKDADHVFYTVEQEKSSAHTVSLTTAMGVVLTILSSLTLPDSDFRQYAITAARNISSKMEHVLSARGSMRKRIESSGNPGRIWIAGGGPNKVAAKEGALKIQETSYRDAYGFETEQMIHGPMRAADVEDDLFIPIIWGKSGSRARELADALASAGGHVMTVSDAPSEHNCMPTGIEIDEPLSPFLTLLPLQLTALYLALIGGTDPDSFRREERHFASIDSVLKL